MAAMRCALLALVALQASFGVEAAIEFSAPIVQFQAVEPTGFRFVFPAEGIKNFELHGVVKSGKDGSELMRLDETPQVTPDGIWLSYSNDNAKLSVGDTVTYWLFFSRNSLGYRYDDQKFEITQLVPRDTKFTLEGSSAGSCVATATTVANARACKGQLLFEEHFKATTIDNKKWRKEKRLADKSRESGFMSYQPEAVSIGDGNLIIKPLFQKDIDPNALEEGTLNLTVGCTGPSLESCLIVEDGFGNNYVPIIASGKVTTRTSFSFKYGKIKIRAKVPQGDWLYPEIYLDATESKYGGDGYASGVIRIAFVRGNLNLKYKGEKYDNTVLNAGILLNKFEPCRSDKNLFKNVSETNWGDDYHEFGVVWTEESITFSVDDVEYGKITPVQGGFKRYDPQCKEIDSSRWRAGTFLAPFDQQFHISMGLGVGGISDFPDTPLKPWGNKSPKPKYTFKEAMKDWISTWREGKELLIDYVKVWAL